MDRRMALVYVAAAAVTHDTVVSIRLADGASVYSAELRAVELALDVIGARGIKGIVLSFYRSQLQRIQAEIIQACIKVYRIDKHQNASKNFIEVVRYFKLWCQIMTAEGTLAHIVQSSEDVENAVRAIEMAVKTLRSRELSCQEARQLIAQKECIAKAEEMAQTYKWDVFDRLHSCHRHLRDIEEILAIASKTEKLLHCIHPSIIEKIKNSKNLCQELKDVQGSPGEQKIQVADLMENELFICLRGLEDDLESLSTLSASQVFEVLTRRISSDLQQSKEITSPTSVPQMQDASFLRRNLQKGIESYKALWQPMFDDSGVTLKEIDVILHSKDIDKEIATGEKLFRKKLDDPARNALVLINRQQDYAAVLKVLPVIGYEIESPPMNPAIAALQNFVDMDLSAPDIRLHEVAKIWQALRDLHLDSLSKSHIDVIRELVNGRPVVKFLQDDIRDDDLRDWIEAVEENTEQFVPISTVSNLIQVQSLIQRILQNSSGVRDAAGVVDKLHCCIDEFSHLDEKIHDCFTNLHGLKSLFLSMADKDEITRDVVRATCSDNLSCMEFISTEGHCSCKLFYDTKGERKFQTLDGLLEHKSRALLMMNSGSKHESDMAKSKKDKADFNRFVECVENASGIVLALETLWRAGHPDFLRKVEKRVKVGDLSSESEMLTKKMRKWSDQVRQWREQYPELNFFFPHQLWTLWSFLKDEEHSEESRQLLRLAGFDTQTVSGREEGKKCVAAEKAREKFSFGSGEIRDAFGAVGKALQGIADMAHFRPKRFPDNIPGDTLALSKVTDTVKEGELFIAALDETSTQTLPTLLSLYKNTTNAFPLPHQVLFCHEGTTWEEIDLLLMRCRGAAGMEEVEEPTGQPQQTAGRGKEEGEGETMEQLFCLVHVEKLPSEIQFKLVDEITRFCSKRFKYFAMICKGTRRHPFLDHFADVVHNVQPLSHSAIEYCFKQLWPDVEVVSSELPGQGKTEFIRNRASERERELATLHISGDVKKEKVLKTLVGMKLTSVHSVHIDLGWISDPQQFDILLFEIVILGCIAFRDQVYLLPISDIEVEVSNTINNTLLKSLRLTLCFARHHLTWDNFSSFSVSDEINSNEQVVCHYLNDEREIGKEDIHFSGKDALLPLPTDKCRDILGRIFSSGDSKAAFDMSYSSVHLFIAVLADQLKKLSCSHFLSVECLKLMAGEEKVCEIRKSFLKALVDIAHDFSMRSVIACRAEQAAAMALRSVSDDPSPAPGGAAPTATAAAMTRRVDSMVRWSDSNHLIIVFHNQDIQTVSALYRDVELVGEGVKKLFETQMKKKLPDFRKMEQRELQEMLQRVARSAESLSAKQLEALSKSYALTPDNLLKMILIILRIQNSIPVIIMGETGCGKTSLIQYLAKICSVNITVKNIHAGTEEEELVEFIRYQNERALANVPKSRWVFLDEINTCQHMGLINDIVCHHQCLGEPLSPNLVLLAACNPYKLRDKTSIRTAGLENKVRDDEQSKLVYRVHPLPETMVDYVWDYGTLSAEGNSDEPTYIERMVGDLFQPQHKEKVVEALAMSQRFIRMVEHNDFCVSLRDVNRFRVLYKWFKKTPSCVIRKSGEVDNEKRATILALAHVYHSRLSNSEKRRQYRTELAAIFQGVWKDITERFIFEDIIYKEQKGILDIMELPPGTAKNTALQENIFVVLTCILNRMPVFLVGKPGCSKSLSLQLIKSSLRGKDSSHGYFKRLPQLHFVRYQGSESSTSEGILKVFEKAKRYKESIRQQQAKHGDSAEQEAVLPVVILDEIGLAEVSKFNPLKVLHSLLEPGEQELPDVAVVGISNWALDAAKMNRAIHLSRPDMDKADLCLTGVSISEAILKDDGLDPLPEGSRRSTLDKDLLEAVANAYDDYRKQLSIENFHGLRDYYSLVKCIARQSVDVHSAIDVVLKGIRRNFGGIPSEMGNLFSIFKDHLEKKGIDVSEMNEMNRACRTLELVEENLKDTSARHLMLITHGDIALSILKGHLQRGHREFEIILGSKFEEDLEGEYSYRVISRIIHYMEQGIVLVLKDLDGIYGSLYDMLNQNYTRIGSKSTCRIALGAYSNQICQVHPEFRCIVLIEEQKLNFSDPPFLNRFEKQRLTLEDDQSSEEEHQCDETELLLKQLSTFDDLPFSLKDLIPVYGPSLVPSLVRHLPDDIPEENKVPKCVETLLKLMTPEGILRIFHAKDMKENYDKTEELMKKYLDLPVHQGLQNYVSSLEKKSDAGVESIVLTHSNPHVDIASCMKMVPAGKIQAERLGNIKSEKMLSDRAEKFWSDPTKEWMIWQCSATSDMANFLLLKTTLEKHKREFMKKGEREAGEKHMLLLIHIERSITSPSLEVLNYLMGWDLAFLDVLEKPVTSLNEYLDTSIIELVKRRDDVGKFVKQGILWGFSRMSYIYRERSPENFKRIVDSIRDDPEILDYLEKRILSWIDGLDFTKKKDWQQDVACNKSTLHECSSFLSALEQEVEKSLQHPLAALIFKIEESNAWDALTTSSSENPKRLLWIEFAKNSDNVNIAHLQAPIGAGCYKCHTILEDLHHPFSRVLFNRIETLKEMFKTVHTSMIDGLNDSNDEEGEPCSRSSFDQLCTQFSQRISQEGGEMVRDTFGKSEIEDYRHDFFEITLNPYPLSARELHRRVLSRYVGYLQGLSFSEAVVHLHCTFWFYEASIVPELELIKACHSLTGGDMQLQEFPGGSIGENAYDDGATQQCSEETPDFARATRQHVDAMCYDLLPQEATFSGSTTTVSKWHHVVSTVICLADRVTTESQSAKCLGVAMDFVSYLSQHFSESSEEFQQHLICLGKLLRKECKVDADDVFDFFMKLVTDATFAKRVGASVQQLFSNYITSCLLEDVEADTSSGFTTVLRSLAKQSSLVQGQVFLAPTLYLAFLKASKPSEVFEMVTKESHEQMKENHLLQVIDKCLQDLGQVWKASDVEMGTPGHLLCMCTDVLQHFILEEDEIVIKDERVELHDTAVFDLIHDCVNCVKSFEFSLRLAMAVAILKKYLTLLGKMMTSENCSPDLKATINKLDLLMNIRPDLQKSRLFNPLERYLVRIILRGRGTKTFHSAVSLFGDQLTFLKRLTNDKKWTALEFTPFSCRLGKGLEKSRAAFALGSGKQDPDKVKERYEKTKFDEKEAFLDLAYACEKFYLPKTYRSLAADEREAVQTLASEVKQLHMPEQFVKLLEFFQSDECIGNFVVADNMKEEDFQIVSVVLHIIMYITATSQNKDRDRLEKPFFSRCLEAPQSLSGSFFPAASETGDPLQPEGFLSWISHEQTVSMTTCKCGARNAFLGNNGEEKKCASCSKVLDMKSGKVIHVSSTSIQNTGLVDAAVDDSEHLGYKRTDPKDLDNPAITVRNMSPCSFRMLQLIIHGCFLGSLALGHCTENALRDFLHLPPETGLIKYLDEHVRMHWKVLQSLTQFGHASLARFLHINLEDLLMLPLPRFDDEVAVKRFEDTFTEHVNARVLKRFSLLKEDVEKSSHHLRKQGFEVVFEEEVEEIDRGNPGATSEGAKYSEVLMQSLLRETFTPDTDKMKSEFLIQPAIQRDFPLVGLVLSKQTQLSLLQHLYPILAWHMYSVKAISYRFNREECKRFTILEYISGFDDSEKDSVEKKFQAFKEAWNAVCKLSSFLKLYNDKVGQLEEIQYDCLLCNCIAMDSSSVILHVLKALVEMHNEFLTDALFLSLSSKTPALGFFRRNESQSCTEVQQLELMLPTQVMQLELHECDVKFSQACTLHGRGKEIEFDFYHYEMMWGRELLTGKPFLEMGRKFPLVAFSGDLIRCSETLSQEVNELIPQIDADDKVKVAVRELQKQNPANLRKLQDSLEVMLSLLVRTGGDPEATIISYLENWASLLSTPPKEIKGFMKREQMKLKQVTGLLEYAEDLQASMVTKTLGEKYRKEVPSKAFELLDDAINKMDDATEKIKQVEMLLRALQKFAFRYLSSVSAHVTGKLADFVMDLSLWPRSSLNGSRTPAMSFLPSQLSVEHLHGTILHLGEEVQKMKETLDKTWLPKQKESRADLEKKKTMKKIKNFKK